MLRITEMLLYWKIVVAAEKSKKKNAHLKKKFWRNLPKMTFTPAQEFQHEDSHANLFIRNWTVELERFRKKTPNQFGSEVHLERVIYMQMGYLEGMHKANDLNLCCSQFFYFANERSVFVGVFPGKSRCRKGKQLYRRIPYRPKKFTLQSAIGPRGY